MRPVGIVDYWRPLAHPFRMSSEADIRLDGVAAHPRTFASAVAMDRFWTLLEHKRGRWSSADEGEKGFWVRPFESVNAIYLMSKYKTSDN